MKQKESFFRSIGKDNLYIVGNLFYVYFVQGFAVIMLGAILPMLQEDYALDYQVSGMLLSVQSVGYALAGLGAGFLPFYLGLKNSFIFLTAGIAVGMGMLLVSGNPIWLLVAMALIGIGRGAGTNYNNQIMSDLARGNASPLNMMHGFFAVGSCIAPVAVMICSNTLGWKLAAAVATVLAVINIFTMIPMKLDNSRPSRGKNKTERAGGSLGFFREKIFWVTMLICFFYQCIESSMMGWLTSFFVGSNVMTNDSAQIVTSALWVALLVGRFSCSAFALRFRPYQMLLVMSAAQLGFLFMLIRSYSFGTMMIATIGLGLGMSGMYATSVSNGGDLFARYPLCMGFFVLMTSTGAIIAPAIVGMIANNTDMRTGFAFLLITAAALIISAIYNVFMARSNTANNRS